MNRQSIFFTISVSFIISILLVIVSFLILITHDYRMKEGQLLDKYVPVMKMVNRQDREAFDEDLAEEGYMEDYQMPICAYGVLQKLHQFKSNSFLNIIEEEVERFII